jgi:drug/metabolite transporter (DMT)-like permease
MDLSGRNKRHIILGSALALLSAVAFALSNTSASLAFHGGSNPLTLAAVRFVLPIVVLTIWLKAQGRPLSLPKRDGWIAIILGVVTAIYTGALLNAIGLIPLSLAVLIFYLYPLIATVIIGVFGWERLGWKTIAAIIIAFAGLALALNPSAAGLNLKGVLLGFVAAIGLGIVVVMSSRVLRASDSRPVTLYMASVAAILLIGFCAMQGDFTLPRTAMGWSGFIAAAFFYAFAMITFFIAISMIGPTRSSMLSYAEPVVAAGLGVILIGEKLTSIQIFGIAVVIAALIGSTLLKQEPRKSEG